MERKDLLHNVQTKGFALVEANLYLDAYTDSEEALKYFHEVKDAYDKAVKEYETVCGPLTASANTGASWVWVQTPWPWEMGVN